MSKRIAVVGMGQGGMVAAVYLARKYEVVVFERNERGAVGYEWKDDITANIFGKVGLPMPDGDVYCQKAKWIFLSPNEKNVLRIPQLKPFAEISVQRRKLTDYFCDLAEKAGCELRFGTNVDGLIVEDEKVVGVKYDGKEERFDLVIDASGLFSKLRSCLPKKFKVRETPDRNDVLYGYRAFFKTNDGAETFDKGIENTMIIKHLGEEGISWCNLNEENEADVLIGKIGELTDTDIEARLADLRKINPILSEEKIREKKVPVCLRCPIATPVADGYVAVGDSAFMPIPIMGSGIESSMTAGYILAKLLLDDDDFSAKGLWRFFVEFMETNGKNFLFLDLIRRLAFRLPSEDIDGIFGCGLVTDEDLRFIMLDKDSDRPKFKLLVWLKKPFTLFFDKRAKKILPLLIEAEKRSRVVSRIPNKYDEKKIAVWVEKYDKALEI